MNSERNLRQAGEPIRQGPRESGPTLRGTKEVITAELLALACSRRANGARRALVRIGAAETCDGRLFAVGRVRGTERAFVVAPLACAGCVSRKGRAVVLGDQANAAAAFGCRTEHAAVGATVADGRRLRTIRGDLTAAVRPGRLARTAWGAKADPALAARAGARLTTDLTCARLPGIEGVRGGVRTSSVGFGAVAAAEHQRSNYGEMCSHGDRHYLPCIESPEASTTSGS